LADASDALTIAVERHDLAALMAASDRAEQLTERVGTIAADLDAVDRLDLDADRISGLRERPAPRARRHPHPIRRAGAPAPAALDAGRRRILAGVGQGSGGVHGELVDDRPLATYRPTGGSLLHLDREA